VRWLEEVSLKVDGDLSDWRAYPVQEIPISYIVPRFKAPSGPQDLSAEFMVLADAEAVYVAFRVRDDVLTFGREGFGTTWRQDCVEVYFDGDLKGKGYYDQNDGQIRVSSDGRKANLEGAVRIGDTPKQLPLLWGALGVEAGLKAEDGSYTVEVRMPASVLGKRYLSPGDRIGLNLKVIDVDHDNALKVVSWQPDPHSTSWITTESIAPLQLVDGEVRFGEPSVKVEKVGPGYVQVMVGPEESPVRKALECLVRGDLSSLEEVLTNIKQNPPNPEAKLWAQYMLAQERKGDAAGAIPLLEALLAEDVPSSIRPRIAVSLAWAYFRQGESEKALQVLLDEARKVRPEDLSNSYRLGQAIYIMSKGLPQMAEGFLDKFRGSFPARCQEAIAHGGYRAYVGHFLLGKFYMEIFPDLDLALEHFEACTRIDPENPDGYLFAGEILRVKGRDEEALVNYRTVLKLKAVIPDQQAMAHIGIARILRNQGHYQEAVRECQAIQGKLRGYALLELAQIYYTLGNQQKAKVVLKEIIQNDPDPYLASRAVRILLTID